MSEGQMLLSLLQGVVQLPCDLQSLAADMLQAADDDLAMLFAPMTEDDIRHLTYGSA